MKVLSLTNPWAMLIKNGSKKIETRSWKTKYRGELYIHASMTKIPKHILNNEKLMALIKDSQMQYGYIICKCDLIDCLYMDDQFLNTIKKDHKEYICGEYEIGRYAWILDNIKILKEPIKVKGKLGIWEYDK